MPQEGSFRMALTQRPRPFLGPPRVLAPRKQGHVSATVQFIVPGLIATAQERERMLGLFERLEVPVNAAVIERASNEGTGQPGVFVSATFYVPDGPPEEADRAIDTASALLIERFLGMLSFLAGVRCVAINAQTSRTGEGQTFSTTLEPSSRAGHGPARLHWPAEPFVTGTPSPHVFNALLWLRRGLAARDPLLTYIALMNGLLSAARDLVGAKPEPGRCARCGGPQGQEASETDRVRELVVGQLGAAPELFDRVWQARRAALGEDATAVTEDVLRRLTELKYDAASLCYRAIKRALGVPLDAPPQLDPSLFVTSTLMDVH